VIPFTSKDDNLNKAHVQYLESRLSANHGIGIREQLRPYGVNGRRAFTPAAWLLPDGPLSVAAGEMPPGNGGSEAQGDNGMCGIVAIAPPTVTRPPGWTPDRRSLNSTARL
jgi:hypothetical protein